MNWKMVFSISNAVRQLKDIGQAKIVCTKRSKTILIFLTACHPK